ncbi:MAG: D-alanine--D-alanine ligase [Actinomycetota bacterium]|nr:D-alanine--D-alanine ligase [Actinomycetota bacterium]
MDGLTLGVIFGGRSVEHDVSVVSAHQVMAVLSDRHTVVPIYITREGRWLTSPALNDLQVYKDERWVEVGEEGFIPPSTGYGGLLVPGGRLKGSRRVALDAVIPMIHGTYGEDGTLQGLLELADIPYTCSGVVGSATGMDKAVMKAAFKEAGLPVVPHVLVDSGRLDVDPSPVLDEVENAIGYPAFVKPARLGSSVGIAKARDRTTLTDALDVAARYDRRILVETAMEGCAEVNCSVLGGPGFEPRPSVCERPVAWEEFLTFDDKYLRGGKGDDEPSGAKGEGMASLDRRIPAPISETLTKQVQDNAVAAFRAVDAAGVARIDSFVKEDTEETWVMEINTIPGSLSFYLWEPTGVSFEELLDNLIEIALTTHRLQRELMFTFESGMLKGVGGMKSSA